MAFDVEGARKAGYSDTEIANYLAAQKTFDVAGARKAGYGDQEIIGHLLGVQKPKDRTYLEAAKDVGAGVVSGVGALTQLPGQLYGLATGDFSDTGLTKVGREIREAGEAMKSEELKRREAERAAKIKEAGKEGEFKAGVTAFMETIKDPALLSNFIAEQAPNLLPGLAVARGLGIAGAGARTAVAGAVGTGAAQQGADIGADTYVQLYKEMVAKGVPEAEAAGRALGYARWAGADAAAISLAAQLIPGGRAIEQAMAKVPIKGGLAAKGAAAIKGGAGETVSEMIEEGGGKVAQNYFAQKVDPTRSITEGLGETMGMAAVGGLGLGTAAGLTRGREAPPPEAPPEPSAAAPVAPTAAVAPPVEQPVVSAPEPTREPTPEPPPPTPPAVAQPPEEATKAMQNYWEGKPEDFGMSFADIQNRDRTKPASIQQMTSIARRPDYNRLSVSRDFGAGAPVVISDVQIDENQLGRVDVVSASDGTKIPVQYAVLDAREITPSNRADGTTIEQYADPGFEGIRPVAGNGRVAGLQELYRSGPYTDYVRQMMDDSAHGINSDIISSIEQPVLVRIMPKSALTPDIADKGNVGGQLGMSPTEQAKIDMGRFDLQGIQFLANGTPSLNSLRQFVAAMPPEEQGNLLNAEGQPNPLAKIRLANALFARAYANDSLIDLYAEATDPEALQILRGMAIAAPAMSNLSEAGDYDIRPYVSKAAELAVNARRQNMDLAAYIDQGDLELDPLTREVVSMFAANKNAPRRIGDSLVTLAAEANKAAQQATAEPDMFGEAAFKRPLEDVFAVLRTEPKQSAPIVEDQPEEQTYKIAKSVQQIAKEVDGMNIMQVADWLINNAPNSFARIVATAIKSRIKVMQDRKIPMTFKVRKGNERSKRNVGSVTYPKERENTFKLELNGPNVPGQKNQIPEADIGTNYRTMLHEMLHLATSGQINVSIRSGESKTGPVGELQKLLTFLRKKVKEDQAAGIPVPPRLNTKRALSNVKELLAYGLTEIEIQQYLSGVTYKKTNGYTKFVEIIRKLLGLNQSTQSSLERLVALSEEILTTPEQEVARVYQAAGVPFGAGVGDVETVSDLETTAPQTPAQKAKAAAQKALQKRTLKKSQFDGVPDDLYTALEPIFAPQNKTIIDKIEGMRDGFWRRLAQGMADQYRRIKDYDEKAYMKARMSKTIDGALEGILFNGQVTLTDGALDIKPGTKGLMQVLEPVGNEVDRYQIWAALTRDAELVRQGKKPSVPPAVVARRNELSSGKLGDKSRIEVYQKVQREMKKLNGSVLNIALRQGLIDKEAYKVFRRDINYIPFYKVIEEDGDVQSAATQAGLINQYFSKALEGGERAFGDLMENTLRNWSHILSASMKNEAANATIKVAMDMNAAFPNLRSGLGWMNGKVYAVDRMEKIERVMNNDELTEAEQAKKINAIMKPYIDAVMERTDISDDRKQSLIDGLWEGLADGDGKLRGRYTTAGTGKVKTMLNGEATYFDVAKDPLLMESIMSIGYMGPKSKFLDVARDFKNMLQFGVTLSPAFKIRNLIRDSVSAMAVSDLKRNPFANVVQGWTDSDRNNPAHISALAGGAIFNFGSYYEGDQAKLIRRLLDKGVPKNTILDTPEKIKKGILYGWDKYQEWGNKSEAANRIALYNQLREKGLTHLEASFQARDLLDFSMQGSWPAFRFLTQIVPFLNARVQGLYKLGRDGIIPTSRVFYNIVTGKPDESTKSDKIRAEQFSIIMAAVALASLALYMAFKDDEEFKKREQWDRDNFWWFKLPGMEHALRIPKPFELGAFGTMAERVAEQIFDQGVEGKVFKDSLSRMLFDTFAVNLPQIAKPLVDLYANKDSFTGAPIETAGMERLSKAERIAEKTGPLAIALSQTANVFLPESKELSPVQADYAIKAYFGWLGSTASWLSHYAVMPFSKSAYPDNNWTETMSAGFIKSLPATQSKYVTAFYENNKEISQAYADMRHFAQLGQADKVQEILAEKGDKIAMAKFYDNASKDMAKMRQVIQAIRNDETMTGAQKKEEIDRMKVLIGELAQQMEEARIEVKKSYAAAR